MLARVLAQRRLELDGGRQQLELHLEPRQELKLCNGRSVHLLCHDHERVGHGARQAVNHDVIDELDVRAPRRRALGDLELAVGGEQQLVNVFAAVVDVEDAGLQVRLSMGGGRGRGGKGRGPAGWAEGPKQDMQKFTPDSREFKEADMMYRQERFNLGQMIARHITLTKTVYLPHFSKRMQQRVIEKYQPIFKAWYYGVPETDCWNKMTCQEHILKPREVEYEGL